MIECVDDFEADKRRLVHKDLQLRQAFGLRKQKRALVEINFHDAVGRIALQGN